MATGSTSSTTVVVDQPDVPNGSVIFKLMGLGVNAALEVFPSVDTYIFNLSASGEDSDTLPTPDATGAASWTWHVTKYTGQDGEGTATFLGEIVLGYSASAQELGTLLASSATAVDPNLLASYLPLVGGTMSGTLAMADNLLTRPLLRDYGESVNAIGSIGGGSQDIDLELGNVVSGTVDTSETTFTFSNPPAAGRAGSFTLILTNGGSQTVNWPGSVDWAGGTAPTLTAAGVDILTFATIDGGTIWYGFAAGLDMS